MFIVTCILLSFNFVSRLNCSGCLVEHYKIDVYNNKACAMWNAFVHTRHFNHAMTTTKNAHVFRLMHMYLAYENVCCTLTFTNSPWYIRWMVYAHYILELWFFCWWRNGSCTCIHSKTVYLMIDKWFLHMYIPHVQLKKVVLVFIFVLFYVI